MALRTSGSYARIAIAGSMRDARIAGIQQAMTPIAAITAATATNVIGSCGATPKSRPANEPRGEEGAGHAEREADAEQHAASLEDHALHAAAVGAEAHANADLVRARAHREREHAGDTDRGDDQRENAERRDEHGVEPARRDALVLDLRDGHHVLDRASRRDASHDARRRGRERGALLSARITSGRRSRAPARTA